MSERIYAELKRRLLSGEFRFRERLDIAKLAGALGASTTPVREALVQLAAERLVVSKPTRGFFVSLWSESELRGLYQWRGALAEMALREFSGKVGPAPKVSATSREERLLRILSPFESVANAELKRAIANADDRLHAARVAEDDVFNDGDNELVALGRIIGNGKTRASYAALRRYHNRRAGMAKNIREKAVVRGLSSNGE